MAQLQNLLQKMNSFVTFMFLAFYLHFKSDFVQMFFFRF